MIIFRLKGFAVTQDELDNRLNNNYIGFMEEILKYLLLHCSEKVSEWDRNHWCNVAAGKMRDVRSENSVKLFLGLVDNYKNLPRKRYTKDFVMTLRKGFNTSSEFLNFMRDYISTKRDNGKVKYDEAMKTCAPYSNEDLIKMCKYIALCLTDQLNPEVDNWYDRRVETTQVDWDKKLRESNLNPKYLRKIMKSITGEI